MLFELKLHCYYIGPTSRKCCKEYEFLSRNLSNKYRKILLDTAAKTGLDTVKPASKKLVHKAAEAIDEFIGNRIADKIVKPKLICDENLRDAAEIIISPEKR